jgi:hypothetical protein
MNYYAKDIMTKYNIEISEEEFKLLKTAKINLSEILFIEEKIDILLENYTELEIEMFGIAINNIRAYADGDYSISAKERNIINRRILNLIASCRMYLDQTAHSFSKIYGKDSDKYIALEGTKTENKKGIKNNEYDNNLAYRVMENIRNHVQHFDLPVDSLTKECSSRKDIDGNYKEHTVQVFVKLESLKENKKFKRNVLEELEKLDERINLISYIRKYLESLGRIHLKIRDMLKPELNKWEETFIGFLDKFKQRTGNEQFTVISYENDLNKINEKFDLVEDIINHRKNLENKNKYLEYFSINYASGKAPILNFETESNSANKKE